MTNKSLLINLNRLIKDDRSLNVTLAELDGQVLQVTGFASFVAIIQGQDSS